MLVEWRQGWRDILPWMSLHVMQLQRPSMHLACACNVPLLRLALRLLADAEQSRLDLACQLAIARARTEQILAANVGQVRNQMQL